MGTAVLTLAATRTARAQRAAASIHRVIAAYRRRLQRAAGNAAEREQIASVDPNGTTRGDGHTLALLTCDNVVRVLLPIALDAAQRGEDASALRAINPITSDAGAAAVVERLQHLEAVLRESTTCHGRGAACASDPHVALGRMAGEAALACQGVSNGSATDESVAEHTAAAVESGMRLPAARAALLGGAVSLLLGMTAIAR